MAKSRKQSKGQRRSQSRQQRSRQQRSRQQRSRQQRSRQQRSRQQRNTPKRSKSRRTKRALNPFMKQLNQARNNKLAEFQYNGKTYKRGVLETGMVIYKRK